jgi:iron-sulfur cluster assembly protein
MELNITLTELAACELRQLMRDQSLNDASLRVWVAGGGCSGLSYGMALDDNPPEEGDIVVEDQGIKIFVDSLSARYLTGSVIDWNADVLGGGFQVTNPNAVRSCGCGSSFSADEEGIPDLNSGRGCGGCGSR